MMRVPRIGYPFLLDAKKKVRFLGENGRSLFYVNLMLKISRQKLKIHCFCCF